jgi:hypothetical protein
MKTHPSRSSRATERTEEGVSLVARLGLAGRTGFYLLLAGITVRIAFLGGAAGDQADAHGALAIVSRPLAGRVAIGGVALGFALFGLGRIIGAVQDSSVSATRRWMTLAQGLFYLAMTYVPASFLAGHQSAGSQQQQQQTTAKLLKLPGGRPLVIAIGVILVAVCAEQIHGAVRRDFADGLALGRAPGWVRRVAGTAGVVGISARALVFLPVGVFLIVSAVEADPARSYGTDGELLRLSGHPWGVAVLAAVAAGLGVFAVFSAIETRYREVISAR